MIQDRTLRFLSAAYPLLLVVSESFEEPPPALRAGLWAIGFLGLIQAADEYVAGQ